MIILLNCPCCNSDQIEEFKRHEKWTVYCADCGIQTKPDEFRSNAHMVWQMRKFGWEDDTPRHLREQAV